MFAIMPKVDVSNEFIKVISDFFPDEGMVFADSILELKEKGRGEKGKVVIFHDKSWIDRYIEILESSNDELDQSFIFVVLYEGFDKEDVLRLIDLGADDILDIRLDKEFINVYQRKWSSIIKKRNFNGISKLKDYYFKVALSEKQKALSIFSAGIAHEINNPLSFVKSNSEILTKYLMKQNILINKLRDNLNIIDIANVKEISSVLDDMLDNNSDSFDMAKENVYGLKRIESIIGNLKELRNEDKLKFVECSIKDILDGIVADALRNTELKVSIDYIANDVPPILCVPKKIAQAMNCLLVNAIESVEKIENGNVKILLNVHNDKIIVKFIDNGLGIDQASMNRIFDIFYTTKEIGKSMGIGLSIAYNIIVNIHGGDLMVEDNLVNGACLIAEFALDNTREEIRR